MNHRVEIVVNGEPVFFSKPASTLLSEIRDEALTTSRNTGRSPEAWEMRNENGFLVTLSDELAAWAPSPGGALFFLSLAVGAMG